MWLDPRRLAAFPIAAVAEVEVHGTTGIRRRVVDATSITPFVGVDVAAQHDVDAVFQ